MGLPLTDADAFSGSGEEPAAMAGAVNDHRWIVRRFATHLGRRVVPWASALERAWTPPLGQSLIAIARKDP